VRINLKIKRKPTQKLGFSGKNRTGLNPDIRERIGTRVQEKTSKGGVGTNSFTAPNGNFVRLVWGVDHKRFRRGKVRRS